VVCGAAAADRWLRAGMNALMMPWNQGDNDGHGVGTESLRPEALEQVIQERASAASWGGLWRGAASWATWKDYYGDLPWTGALGLRVMAVGVRDSACRDSGTGLKAMQ